VKVAFVLQLPLDHDREDERVFTATESQGSGETLGKRYGIESFGCLQLYQAGCHSISTGAAIVFT